MQQLIARRVVVMLLVSAFAFAAHPGNAQSDELAFTLTSQVETSPGSGRFHRLQHSQTWNPEETAIIVCDMWDLHHCLNAVRRENEFAPRLQQVIAKLRDAGVTVIHSPSSCMDFYADHPSRLRARQTPRVAGIPEGIDDWCSQIPVEENVIYPIDQSNGGEDDDPTEHQEWAEELAARGLNPRAPWSRQIDTIEINDEKDYISDNGSEIWSILEANGAKNVILAGVHTNMCVLGRPFGLRQLAKNGKHVVLMRDMTDTMYEPNSWPYVSHFTGTDLIVAHIERHICPTITSDQVIGGEVFRFQNDRRPHIAMMIGEDEYQTEESLPALAAAYLGKDFRVSYVFGDDEERNDFPGVEQITAADLLVISVRRRPLPKLQLDVIRRHVELGKPVIGIRTASHAFSLRNRAPDEQLEAWDLFDAEVFGGNYTNHYGNERRSIVTLTELGQQHPITSSIEDSALPQAGSLYRTSPLDERARVLAIGTIDGEEPEPLAWTFTREDGGKSFYTSMGHTGDFEQAAFRSLLVRAMYWCLEMTPNETLDFAGAWPEIARQ